MPDDDENSTIMRTKAKHKSEKEVNPFRNDVLENLTAIQKLQVFKHIALFSKTH